MEAGAGPGAFGAGLPPLMTAINESDVPMENGPPAQEDAGKAKRQVLSCASCRKRKVKVGSVRGSVAASLPLSIIAASCRAGPAVVYS